MGGRAVDNMQRLLFLAVALLASCTPRSVRAFRAPSLDTAARGGWLRRPLRPTITQGTCLHYTPLRVETRHAQPLSTLRRKNSAITCLRAQAPQSNGDVALAALAKGYNPFDVETAVLCAGFAFEAYNEPSPNDARWERGADGCDVAFMSEAFARQCYAGRLEVDVRLCEAEDLPPPTAKSGLAQKLMTGNEADAYVVFALNEEARDAPKQGAIALLRAVDRARSSTVWSNDKTTQGGGGGGGGGWRRGERKAGRVEWGGEEVFSLYVKDPTQAQLALTVFDEQVLADDEALGAASVPLLRLFAPKQGGGGGGGAAGGAGGGYLVDFRAPDPLKWSGWVDLTWRPSETQDGAVALASVAGLWVAGPLGAAAGGLVGSLFKKRVQGRVRLEVEYKPLRVPGAAEEEEQQDKVAAELQQRDKVTAELQLANRRAPKGGSAGIDWSTLVQRLSSRRVLAFAARKQASASTLAIEQLQQDKDLSNACDSYELCCFVSHNETSTQVAMWRNEAERRIVLSFRGTSDILDVLTDVQLLQTPLEMRDDGKKSDDKRMVHSGFYAGASAVSRRLKELLVSACAIAPSEWEVLVTGHSLGGALATLMAGEIAAGIDPTRGFKKRQVDTWFTSIAKLVMAESNPEAPPPSLGRVRMYTFGAPRVGNSEYARFFDGLGIEAFRIVNGQDIVARMPRHANSAGAVLDYEHVGKTVLVEEESFKIDKGFWVEGESAQDTCPLRDVSPITNPFSSGTVLGDISAIAGGAFESIGQEGKSFFSQPDAQKLTSALNAAMQQVDKAREGISNRVGSANALDAVSLLGLDKKFVEMELKMIESLTSGTALLHHLEPSYFAAMGSAVEGWESKNIQTVVASLSQQELEDVIRQLQVDNTASAAIISAILRERERLLMDSVAPKELADGAGGVASS